MQFSHRDEAHQPVVHQVLDGVPQEPVLQHAPQIRLRAALRGQAISPRVLGTLRMLIGFMMSTPFRRLTPSLCSAACALPAVSLACPVLCVWSLQDRCPA